MLVVDVTKLFKEFLVGSDSVDGETKQLGDDEIILSQVKLRTKSQANPPNPVWGTGKTDDKEDSSTVKIVKSDNASPGAFGQVHTTKESGKFVKVSIDSGIVRGLNRPLELRLDQREADLVQAFGNYLEIDPSKPQSEPQQIKVKIGAAVEGTLGPQGAMATVHTKEKEYKGRFACTVVMKGFCLAGAYQYQIAEVIRKLKEKQQEGARGQRINDDLSALTVTGDGEVEFNITGKLECRWNFEQEVHWK